MAFSLASKSHEKNMVDFILFHGIFMGFLCVRAFFMGHEALNIKGIFMLFSWDFHAIFMVFFREKSMKIPH